MKPKNELKTYTPPKLIQFGSVKELTSAGTGGGKEDPATKMDYMGMSSPMNMPT